MPANPAIDCGPSIQQARPCQFDPREEPDLLQLCLCERMSMTGYPHPNDISAPRVLMPHEHLTLTRGHVSVDFDLRTLPDRGLDIGPVWNS